MDIVMYLILYYRLQSLILKRGQEERIDGRPNFVHMSTYRLKSPGGTGNSASNVETNYAPFISGTSMHNRAGNGVVPGEELLRARSEPSVVCYPPPTRTTMSIVAMPGELPRPLIVRSIGNDLPLTSRTRDASFCLSMTSMKSFQV